MAAADEIVAVAAAPVDDAPPVLTSEPIAESYRPSRERLQVAANPDGNVTLAPSDPANEVLLVGNPASGVVEVHEVRPIAEQEKRPGRDR